MLNVVLVIFKSAQRIQKGSTDLMELCWFALIQI